MLMYGLNYFHAPLIKGHTQSYYRVPKDNEINELREFKKQIRPGIKELKNLNDVCTNFDKFSSVI